MSYLDIAVVGVAVLFFLFGLWKGFLKPCVSLASIAGAFLLVYFFAGDFGAALASTKLGEALAPLFDSMSEKLGESGLMVLVENSEGALVTITGQAAGEFLASALKIPVFIANGLVANMGPGLLGEQLVNSMVTLVCTVIGSAIILVGMGIITVIVKIIIRKVNHFKPVGWLDRILGGVAYLVVGIFFIYLVLTIMSTVIGVVNNDTTAKIQEMMTAPKSLTNFMMQYNPITLLINLIMGK